MSLSTKFHTGRRQALRVRLKEGEVAIVPAAHQMQRSGSTTYPFRQDSNFWYLTGLNTPRCWLLISNHPDLEDVLVLPDYDAYHIQWLGGYDGDQIKKTAGLGAVIELKELSKIVDKLNKELKFLYPKPIQYSDSFSLNPHVELLEAWLSQQQVETSNLWPYLKQLRMVKQPVEIEQIKQAVAVTQKGFDQIKKDLTNIKNESDIERIFNTVFADQSVEHAYNPIVAAGPRATTIHYQKNNQTIGKEDLVLIDVGAEWEYYCADVTRTYAPRGMTTRQQEVYEAVAETKEQLIKSYKPAATLKEIHQLCRQLLKDKLVQLNLLKAGDDIDKVSEYFPHTIGHSLGLDTHDPADYNQPLEANMVITLEPGLYLPEEGIGVRIEDDILITQDGNENLSAKINYRI